ncbi:retrovirus-related pol polyprotein from transposon TNT 1-94 [Tanacetum coccineum]
MSTILENVIAAGAENRPPMLEYHNSWKSRMLLYIRGKEHGKKLIDSVKNGPFQFGTVEVPATPTTPASKRFRTMDDLTEAEKICEACDIRATNIILQGLEFSLQERESKLYNEFDRFTSEKGETIYSIRFAKYFEIEKKELLIENDRLLEQIISQDIVCIAMRSYDDLVKYVDMLDMQPLSLKLRKNREAHVDYLKQTKEHADTLRAIVKQAKALKPLDNTEELVAVTPMNKNRQVSVEKTSNTSANTIQKQVDAYNNQNTNRSSLPSTGVKSSTNVSGSHPRSNTRNNRISRTSSSNVKNKKVEVYPRNVKSNLKKTNHVSVCNENVKHGMLNANSEYVCSTCNECLFYANHDMCVVDYLNDVNPRARAKSVKSIKNNEWKPTDLKYLHVFGALCYLTNDTEDLGKLKPKVDIVSSTPYVPPSKKDWDILFQPMFDEYFQPPLSVVSLVSSADAPIPSDTTGTPLSTTIDQDAPSASTSPTTKETQAPIIHQGVEQQLQGIQNAQFDNDPFINIFTLELKSKESSSWDVIPSNLHQINKPFDYLKKWTKDHMLDNNYKEAMKESSKIESMQEEIHEFDRLQVSELVPRPNQIMLVNLKWIFKVKLDEFGGALKNKARLAAKGYHQEEGIDFEESFATLNLVDNSKLNDVDLLLRRLKQNVSLLEGLQGGKKLLFIKRNKAISLGMNTSKVAGQRKPEGQWTGDERKAANLDQRLKSLILFVLPDDQMNFIINCLTAKPTWDDLILYHEGPFDVKEIRVMDLKYKALMNELVNDGIKLSKLKINTGFINGLPKKWLSFCQSLRNTNHVKESELASLFGKLKYEENLIDSIYESEKKKYVVTATPLSTAFFSTSVVQDFQDSPDDEEDTRSSQEYLNDLEEEYQERALLAKSKRFFKKGSQRFSSAKATDDTICYECGRKAYEWVEEDVSSYDNDMTEVKVLMALVDDENVNVGKESARNEQRNNLVLKHRDLVQELNTSKEQLLVLKQAKLDFLTMHHLNTEILKENKNLGIELKELIAITETWLSSSNKVSQCISKQIPSQKKINLGLDQLTEDPYSSRQTDMVFVKSSAEDIKVSIPGIERPCIPKPRWQSHTISLVVETCSRSKGSDEWRWNQGLGLMTKDAPRVEGELQCGFWKAELQFIVQGDLALAVEGELTTSVQGTFKLRDIQLLISIQRQRAFLTVVDSSRFHLTPIINLELHQNQETRPIFKMAGHSATSSGETMLKLFRQCTQPKRPRNEAWYKDKAMLAKAQEARQMLDEEQTPLFLQYLGGFP